MFEYLLWNLLAFLIILVVILLIFRFLFLMNVGVDDGGVRVRSWVPATRLEQAIYEWGFRRGERATERRLKRQRASQERLREYERKLMLKERRNHKD